MKKSFLYIILIAMGCSKIDDSYKDLIEPGGRVYVEKPKALARPGYKKVDIVWPKTSDPNVIAAKIYWNNFADSVSVNINPAGDSVKVPITGLLEQFYTFIIRTYDKDGNTSVPVEINGRAYGDNYLSGLNNRVLQSAAIKAGVLTLNWGAPAVYNGEVGVQLSYTDSTNVVKTRIINNSQTASVISDYLPSTQFRYRSMFLADSNAVDTVYTNFQTINEIKLDKTLWKVIAFSSQHPGPENMATNMIDGTDGTRWHTAVPQSSFPHFITINMGSVRTVSKFTVERTLFAVPAGDDRGPDRIQFLISNDNLTWKDLGTFNFNRLVNGEQSFPVTDAAGRYFKLVGVSGPNPFMVLGEVSAYGF